MGKFAETAARNAKALETAIGSGLLVGTLAMDHASMLPGNVTPWLATGIAFFTVFRTWLVRNEDTIEKVADAVEDLYEDVREIHPTDLPVNPPPPRPYDPAEVQTEQWQAPYGHHARDE
jgi:hypothetical protein